MTNSIKILGASGGISNGHDNTCLLVNYNTTIDAGNIIKGLEDESINIDHILISHTHMDHIQDIPFLIEKHFETRTYPLKIYSTKDSINNLRNHIFNNIIWPDFSKIKLAKVDLFAIEFIEIEYNKSFKINDTIYKAIKNDHTLGSCAFLITKDDKSILFTSDTYDCKHILEELNKNMQIKSLIIEVSFPSRFEDLAKLSKHLTPKLLKEQLKSLKRDDLRIFINHMKPIYGLEINNDLLKEMIPLRGGKTLDTGDTIPYDNNLEISNKMYSSKKDISQLIEIGESLTKEKNIDTLMEKILIAAKTISNADAGTLYIMSSDEKSLQFKVVQTDSLHIQMGGTKDEITWPALNIYNEQGEENTEMVAVLCAVKSSLINIEDVYNARGFNFEGTKSFDKSTGYRTKSMLVVPMTDHEGDVIGVLQLLNKKNFSGESSIFTKRDEKLIQSMSSQAAVSITNTKLIHDLEGLLDAFIKSIAAAIDEKSPYTGGHIGRVAQVTMLFVNEINKDETIFKNKYYDEHQQKEMRIAAWMHDIGKIATPEYVVNKAKKLETIFDRIEIVKARFELLKAQTENQLLKEHLDKQDIDIKEIDKKITKLNKEFDEELSFIELSNKGSEFMTNDAILKIEEISKRTIMQSGEKNNILNEDMIKNLTIKKGTLTNEERSIINNHALLSIKMLESLPFPKKLKNIPTIAGGHHEKISGAGYPFGLKGDEISFDARILAIADIFEALTSHDRPYKDPNTLNQSLRILSFMVKDGELDKDLVKFFIDKKLHLKYAKDNLTQEQMDEITVTFD